MTVYTAARGEVVGAPVHLTTDTGSATVLILREAPLRDPSHPSDPSEPNEPGVEYQVCLREPDLARQVLEGVRLGDRLVVLGTLQLRAISGPLEDTLTAAQVSLVAVAVAIGLDLTSA